jgi:hypothetical protein
MEIERVSDDCGRVGLWAFEWDLSKNPAAKVKLQLLGYEQPVRPLRGIGNEQRNAICWSYGRTLGNIAVFSEEILGSFPSDQGDDAILACDIVEAGKMRNGAKRWWCRTHQRHWGTKGDVAAGQRSGNLQCANHLQPMSYIIDPPYIRIEDHEEIGIWCALPPALASTGTVTPRRPAVHVCVSDRSDGPVSLDQEHRALSLHYNPTDDLFGSTEIAKVHVTPPAAFEFTLALERGVAMGCINCRDCGYPHLDLGEFGRTAHSKHLCGNCGRDNTWSRDPIASTPLKPLYDQFARGMICVDADGVLNLDDYPDSDFTVWASTPAVLWKSRRPQYKGIRVRLTGKDGRRLGDSIFGTVIRHGKPLDRSTLLNAMIANTLV